MNKNIKAILCILLLYTMYELYMVLYPCKFIKNKISKIIYNDFNIPKVIFRTFSELKVSTRMYDLAYDKWIQLNPDYNMVYYTNRDCDNFMEKYFKGEVNDAYKQLIPGAFKADLWRNCILYKFGGVYVDVFATPFCSIEDMCKNYKNEKGLQFISILDASQSESGIHNGFIIAEKEHPFLKQAISDIVKNVHKKYYGTSPLAVTGPIALERSIKSCLKKYLNNKNLPDHFKAGINDYEHFSFYLFKLKFGPRQYVYDNGTVVMSKYFDFFYYIYRKLFQCNKNYGLLWACNKVYKNMDKTKTV